MKALIVRASQIGSRAVGNERGANQQVGQFAKLGQAPFDLPPRISRIQKNVAGLGLEISGTQFLKQNSKRVDLIERFAPGNCEAVNLVQRQRRYP